MTRGNVTRKMALAMAVSGSLLRAAPMLQDSDFSAQEQDSVSLPWEVRYGLKASEPTSRPRWAVIPRRDEDGVAFLSCEETGPAAGSVLIGQRWRVPETMPSAVELSVTFQTFCEMTDRSGMLHVGVCSPDAWDRLARIPENAQPVETADWFFLRQVHRNRDDVTSWETRRALGRDLDEALASQGGRDVVIAVMWATWHPNSTEWFRLQRLHLGEPEPWLEWAVTPAFAVVGEPFSALLRAYAPDDCRVEAGVRFGSADPGAWQWVRCEARGEDSDLYSFEVGEGDATPSAVRARLIREGREVTHLPPVALRSIARPEHPCVFFTPAMIEEMKTRIERFDWAADQFEKHRANADNWLEPRDMPEIAPGGWSHDYVCADDGSRLRWRADHPTEHLCPSCGKEWSDPKRNALWRSSLHGRFASGLRDLGIAWQVTGDDRYAQAGKRIFLWYADHYMEYPEGRGPAGRGRVHSQSLSECTWLIRMMEGADLLFPAMTRAEKRRVEQGLLRPGVSQISRFRFGIHNIQCWHNACMAVAGYFLGDPEWVVRGNEGAIGFHAQVENGILEDGMWYERSLGYHNYTLSALVTHCEAARNNGEDLHMIGRIRGMFTVPLRMAQPNLVPPSLNDQGYRRGPIGTFPLEMAWAWYEDATAAGALRYLYDSGRTRGGLHALKYGRPLPEDAELPTAGSVDMPGAGLVILRLGGRDGVCAMLEYGEHGGGHGHPDKLQIILYGLGRTLCPDLGTTGYGVPLHREWYKTTPSHNTVTIGSRNQGRAKGNLLGFETGDGWAAAAAETTEAYRDWRLQRSILLTERYLVDCFDVTGEEEDIVDWFLRAPGTLGVAMELQPIDEEPPNRTYAYLQDMRGAVTDAGWQAAWTLPEQQGSLVLTMAGGNTTQVVQCLAPAVTGQPPWGTLRVRRRASATRFLTVYQIVQPDAAAAEVIVTPRAVHIGDEVVRLPGDEGLMRIP